jgi:cytochrome c oxidase cbb3-type subunit 3
MIDMRNKALKTLSVMLPLLLISVAAWAQDAAEAGSNPYFYDTFLAWSLVALAGVVVVAALGALFYLLNVMVKVNQIRIYQEMGIEAYQEAVSEQGPSFWERMYKKWTDAVPVEKEQDVMLDHNYDGIKELDNSLPPWWVAMFYLTIGFAVVYMTYYHFTDAGAGSAEEYEMEMERAEKAVAAYLATQANLIDETNVTPLVDEDALAAGQTIYNNNCAACHGMQGEGGVGPNMTDKYWIHGGDIKDVFSTIKYGVPEKGMISWKAQLSAADMHKVSSYILTMQGTNPPNAKEPQGELYEPQADNGAESPATDSTATSASDEEALGMNQ